MADEAWRSASRTKLAANYAKIPKEWRLGARFLQDVAPNSHLNVLDVPRECGILTKGELEITGQYDATALVGHIASKRLGSHEVVLAFCKRAAIAHQLLMFEDALARARYCDEYLGKHGTTIGPLHGLPISVKDSSNVKGYQTIMGYAAFASNPPATNNSGIVDILLKAVAVIMAKTNVPQTMMSADTENNIFGRTLNPHKLSLTAGGSTGGEGALLAMRGSVLGVGTDIAGSVRIPAFCNGVYALKPTAKRLPYAGELWDGRLGSPSQVPSTIGPMGHSIRDLNLFMQVAIDANPWFLDESCLNIPWRRMDASERKLRLGMILEDAKRPLHPPMIRTMRSAEKALTMAGHTIMDVTSLVPSIWYTASLAWRYFSLDPRKTGHDLLKDEPIIKSLPLTSTFPENDGWEASLDTLWDLNLERSRIMAIYRDLFVQNQLDGIIMPPYQSTAQPHDLYGAVPYTVLANFLNYPAAQIPYLHADKVLDELFLRADIAYEPTYDADAIEGAPSGIQIVGKPLQDEELVHMMTLIDEVLNGAE